MVVPEGMYFTSLTHGKSPDCRLANADLRERLEDYKFGNFVLEPNCWRCPNDTCNLSFILILPRSEFYRLRHQVRFDTRPTFLIHRSFKELLGADQMLRAMGAERKEIGIQNVPQMAHASIDASPPVRVALSQTDFKVGKQDTGIQTEVQTVDHADSSIRTTETQDSDDDDFVEMRVNQVAPTALKEVKVEEILEEEENEEEVEEEEEEHSIVGSDSETSKPDSDDSYQSANQSISIIEQPEAAEPEPQPVPAIKLEPVDVPSPAPSASIFNTPRSLVRSPTDDSQSSVSSSVKRMRLMDIEHCEVCWFVSEDNCMSQYCQHVLDSHVSIFRFKCKHCALRFTDSDRAKFHLRASHDVQETSDNQYIVEIARDQLMKFLKFASNSYPDKFRGISIDGLEEILLSLP